MIRGNDMKQGNRKLNTVFRILVFATFFAALFASVVFLIFGFRVADSSFSMNSMYYGNSEEAGMVIQSSIGYFIMTGLAVVSFIFSIICFKCTSAVASIFRTIFIGIMALLDIISISAVITAYQMMRYLSGDTDLYSSLMNNTMLNNSSTFEEKYMMAIIFMFVTAAVFFVLSITSIVSLVSKPSAQNAGYQQQMPYGQTPNMPYGQPMQQAAPTYNQPVQQAAPTYNQPAQQAAPTYNQPMQQPTQPSQPKIVGYDTQTGAPIYEKQ